MAEPAVKVCNGLGVGPRLVGLLDGSGLVLMLMVAKVLLGTGSGLVLAVSCRACPNGL